MLNISERLPSYCLVMGTRIWKILSSCWERNEGISLEVCLSEECRYATCETRTLHGSVSHPPVQMCVRMSVCMYYKVQRSRVITC